jgi:hypothetical protein
VLPVKREHQTSFKHEHQASVKHERPASVKREIPVSPVTKMSLYADVSDSELTDDLAPLVEEDDSDSDLTDDMPPLLWGVEADQVDVLMPLASPMPVPAAISTTVSTASSLSGDSLVGLGESISGARPAAQRMGAAGPSRVSGLGTAAPITSTDTSGMRVLLNSVTRKLYPDP